MVLERDGTLRHLRFPAILDYLGPGDLAVFNDTRVVPARLRGTRPGTGGGAEILLLHSREDRGWNVLLRPARRTRTGTVVDLGEGVRGTVRGRDETGTVIMDFSGTADLAAFARRHGSVPLPPYIRRKNSSPATAARDRERYQTVYAARDGAAAAPTAGLHFSRELLREMEGRGTARTFVTLHVGYGTFQPVRTSEIEEHRMHAEHYEITENSAEAINRQVREDRPLWLVGTTAVRALESAADENGRIAPGARWTDIFIVPGYRFRLPFRLLTNFHLPASTLLMLVCALAGKERILDAYREAVRREYRFFSYGDAMLIL